MTDYELSVSLDNRQFESVQREQVRTPVELVIRFPKRQARFVRITSYAAVRPIYPTTFFEIEVGEPGVRPVSAADPVEWRLERALRRWERWAADGATDAMLKALGDRSHDGPALSPRGPRRVPGAGPAARRGRFGIPGRLAGQCLSGPATPPKPWAISATARAVPALLAAYARYAKRLDGKRSARRAGRRQNGLSQRRPHAGDAVLDRPRPVPSAAGRSRATRRRCGNWRR